MSEPTPVSGAEVLAAAAAPGAYYPEHDKQHALLDKAHLIGDFLEWLESAGYGVYLNDPKDGQPWQQIYEGDYNHLLERFFGLDAKRLETEKRTMLAQMRAANRDRD